MCTKENAQITLKRGSNMICYNHNDDIFALVQTCTKFMPNFRLTTKEVHRVHILALLVESTFSMKKAISYKNFDSSPFSSCTLIVY